MLPTQLQSVLPTAMNDVLIVLNVNIRSLSKNFDKLKECIKTGKHEFTVIGLSETHLKDKPHDFYSLPGYNIEYVNSRVGRSKGGVCMYVNNHTTIVLTQVDFHRLVEIDS